MWVWWSLKVPVHPRRQVEKEAEQVVRRQPKKQKVLTEEQKTLQSQNKAIEADKAKSAKQRLNYLLQQSDLFKHFGMIKDDAASKKKRRKTEKEARAILGRRTHTV